MLGRGDASFEPALEIRRSALPYALAARDLNLDGAVDVVVGYVRAPSTVYFNDGTGRSYTPVEVGDRQGTTYGFAFGDFDLDGQLDIAVARSDARNMVYLAGVE
jgi:hypothetical protein